MKRLTREERRRIQRRAANIRFLAFVLILLALGVCIGYTAAHAQDACEPPELQEVSQPSPVDDMPQEPAEQPAEDYSSLDRLELIGTFTATAYCPCVKCCGIWSEDHPSRGEDYVQKTRAGTIPEEGRTIAADWDVLPKGSEVVINGHPYIVEDTGSAVKGNHVDIFFESHEAACEFGIQQVEHRHPAFCRADALRSFYSPAGRPRSNLPRGVRQRAGTLITQERRQNLWMNVRRSRSSKWDVARSWSAQTMRCEP